MNDTLSFEIDLNMLHGDRVRSHVDCMRTPLNRTPEQGEAVWAIDEDGAYHLAIIEAVHPSGFVDLQLLSTMPMTYTFNTTPRMVHWRDTRLKID